MAGQLIRRGDRKWCVRVFLGCDGNGKRAYQNRTVQGSKKDAEKVLADLLTKRSMGPNLIDLDRVLMGELFDDLERDYRLNGKDAKWCNEVVRLHLRPFFGATKAARVTSATVAQFADAQLEKKAAVATINRQLSLLKRSFNLARQCTPPKVHEVPHIRMFREDNARKGFFEHEEFVAMRAALPDYIKPAFVFAYYTGCRKGEVLGLQWPQVDLLRGVVRLEVGETKNGEGRIIPLATEVVEVLKLQKQRTEAEYPGLPWVFHYNGERLQSFNKAWRTASKAAGLVDAADKPTRLFHDLRRTAVRNLVRAGTSESVSMKVSGHKSRTVFMRYNVTTEADLQEAVANLGSYVDGLAKKAAAKNPHTIGTQEGNRVIQ